MKKFMSTLLVAATAFISFSFAGCADAKSFGRKEFEVSLNEYFLYSTQGDFSGDISIQGHFNYDSFLSDYYELDLSSKEIDELRLSIGGSWNQETELSNGDVAIWTWNINEEVLDEILEDKSIVLDFDTTNYKVPIDGFMEREAFDPFDYVDVTFSGVAPYITMSIQRTSDAPNIFTYTSDKRDHLCNGDVVTVTLTVNERQLNDYCNINGCYPTRTIAEYEVLNLDQYMVSASDLTPDMINTLATQAENVFRSETNWGTEEAIDGVTYDGIYFLNHRFPENLYWASNEYNLCYVILKIDAHNDVDGSFTYYYYVRFDGLILKNDGTFIVDLSHYQRPYGGGGWGSTYGNAFRVNEGSHYYYVGCRTVDEFYQNVILTDLVDYDYTTTYATN